MSDENTVETPQQEQPRAKGCLPGCLIMLAVLVVAVVGFAFLIRAYKPRWIFVETRKFLVWVMENSAVAEDTKKDVENALAKLAKFEQDKEKLIQINEEMKKILKPSFSHAIFCAVVDARIAESSGIDPEEKAKDVEKLRIFYTARMRGKITDNDQGEILRIFPRGENKGVKSKWTDEEIRKVMDKISQVVKKSASDISAEGVDYKAPILETAAEIVKLADKLAGKPKKAPATRPAPKATPSAEKPARAPARAKPARATTTKPAPAAK